MAIKDMNMTYAEFFFTLSDVAGLVVLAALVIGAVVFFIGLCVRDGWRKVKSVWRGWRKR